MACSGLLSTGWPWTVALEVPDFESGLFASLALGTRELAAAADCSFDRSKAVWRSDSRIFADKTLCLAVPSISSVLISSPSVSLLLSLSESRISPCFEQWYLIQVSVLR